MTGGRDRRLPAWLLGSGVIAVAMGLMNLGTYGFTILAARLLGPVDYGALAALMGVLLVVNVASLGLQATGARRVAATPEHVEAIERQLLAAGSRAALALGALCLVASPVLTAVLGLDGWLPAGLLAATVVPLTLMGGYAGVLQGERRWLPLALVYLTTGLGRIGCGVLGLLVRPDAVGAMAGVAVGACLPAAVGWAALRRPAARRGTSLERAPGGLTRELLHNSHALLAFFALSNVDVIMARALLDEHDAGLYAGGLILTKAVLFLPQFVVVFAFPSMARSQGAAATLRKGLLLVLGIGAAATAGIAALPQLAVVFVGGGQYAEIAPLLWAFAVLGTLLALLQLTVYGVVAQQDQRAVRLVWATLLLVVALAVAVTRATASVPALVVLVVAADAALLLLLLGQRRRGEDRAAVAAPGATAVA